VEGFGEHGGPRAPPARVHDPNHLEPWRSAAETILNPTATLMVRLAPCPLICFANRPSQLMLCPASMERNRPPI
jgi:hypothetical protein